MKSPFLINLHPFFWSIKEGCVLKRKIGGICYTLRDEALRNETHKLQQKKLAFNILTATIASRTTNPRGIVKIASGNWPVVAAHFEPCNTHTVLKPTYEMPAKICGGREKKSDNDLGGGLLF